jgi:hypothetical protein
MHRCSRRVRAAALLHGGDEPICGSLLCLSRDRGDHATATRRGFRRRLLKQQRLNSHVPPPVSHTSQQPASATLRKTSHG